MKHYSAILFDLFNTVALYQPDRLPLFEWHGKTSHSTMGILRKTVEEQLRETPFATFLDALWAANEEIAARRASTMREIPTIERFTLALTKIGYPNDEDTRRRADILSRKHMELLAVTFEIPEIHTDFLRRACDRYPLALVSNFDHSLTAHHIVERDGAAHYFDPIVISDDHGWRKPHPSIFAYTLDTLGIAAEDALYVGDSIEDDVAGAKGAGLDIAWINARGAALPDDSPAPDYVVAAIPELAGILLRE